MKPTLEEIFQPLEATCGDCGAKGTIYPNKEGRGTMFCPVCSPVWLGEFLEFKFKKDYNELSRGVNHDTNPARGSHCRSNRYN